MTITLSQRRAAEHTVAAIEAMSSDHAGKEKVAAVHREKALTILKRAGQRITPAIIALVQNDLRKQRLEVIENRKRLAQERQEFLFEMAAVEKQGRTIVSPRDVFAG